LRAKIDAFLATSATENDGFWTGSVAVLLLPFEDMLRCCGAVAVMLSWWKALQSGWREALNFIAVLGGGRTSAFKPASQGHINKTPLYPSFNKISARIY
jgi:hypothetical protein